MPIFYFAIVLGMMFFMLAYAANNLDELKKEDDNVYVDTSNS